MSGRMPQTPEEEERDRKKRERQYWEKILAYYMMQKWEKEQKQEEKKIDVHPVDLFMIHVTQGRDLAELIFEKQPGRKSLFELLEDMEPFQEEDSPFRSLLHTMRERPEDKQGVKSALEECIRVAPARILDRQRALGRNNGPENEIRRAEEERRLEGEMCFLRGVMPRDLYLMLCRELTLQGRITDPERDFLYVPDRESRVTYEQYTARHRTEPQEREGKLSNADQVFTSAAYMMAAWEQRNEAVFDERKADARAMELFNGRAFRTYMDRHPGSLLAAARNTGLDIISTDLAAEDADLARRSAMLRSARDTLKPAAAGKPAAFQRMANALDRCVSADGGLPEEDLSGLKGRLAEYVLSEDPKSEEYDRKCVVGAMRALKALMPEQDFSRFLNVVNHAREPGDQIDGEQLDTAAARNERGREELRREAVPGEEIRVP